MNETEGRTARQAALLIAAVGIDKERQHIAPQVPPSMDANLVNKARSAIADSMDGSTDDPFDIIHNINRHPEVRKFLDADGKEAKAS